MNRDLIKHLNSEQRKREEEKQRKIDKYHYDLNRLNQKSPTTIIDMKSAYEKVKEKDDITLNQDYERLTSSTYKYKL